MSVNRAILVGHLGADPEVRATPGGLQVSNLRVATNHVAYDRDGNKNESTEWHRVVFFGRQAEVCEQYLRKGSQVYVEGRLRTNKYTDRDGIERYQTEVVGERMQMLGGRDDSQSSGGQQGFKSQGKVPGSDYAKAKGGSTPPASFEDFEERHDNDHIAYAGKMVSLRDYFAAQVIGPAFLDLFTGWRQRNEPVQEDWPLGLAIDAYRVADAMLKERTHY